MEQDQYSLPVAPAAYKNTEWMHRAACKGEEQYIFFEAKRPDNVKLAKLICSTCPVRVQCLNYAIEANEEYGIWGGMTTKERRGLK
jgi:WhiB family redox-sensing transcriptional regulator